MFNIKNLYQKEVNANSYGGTSALIDVKLSSIRCISTVFDSSLIITDCPSTDNFSNPIPDYYRKKICALSGNILDIYNINSISNNSDNDYNNYQHYLVNFITIPFCTPHYKNHETTNWAVYLSYIRTDTEYNFRINQTTKSIINNSQASIHTYQGDIDVIMVSKKQDSIDSSNSFFYYFDNFYKYNNDDLIICENLPTSSSDISYNINVNPNKYYLFFTISYNCSTYRTPLNFGLKISHLNNDSYGMTGYWKDGRDDNDYGNYFNQIIDGNDLDNKCYYLAIHKNIENYKVNNKPLICTGSERLDGNGYKTIDLSSYSLSDASYCVLLTPIDTSYILIGVARMYSLQVYNKSNTQFDVIGHYKVVRNGYNGAGVAANLDFQWAVIRNN